MWCRFAVVVTMVFAVSLAVAQPAGAAHRRRGETSVDVTVRRWPAHDAPALLNLPAGSPVVALGRWRGWVHVTGFARGWIPAEGFTAAGEGQERAAPAPVAAAAPRGGGLAPQAARSESDLMFDALTAARGESPNSARIARVVAEAGVEARRKAEATRKRYVVAPFWKDPFSEDPERLIPVRLASSDAELVAARRETARARAEAAMARADAAAARAEAARAEAAGARADALAARHEAEAARAGCGDASAGRGMARGRGAPPREELADAGAGGGRPHQVRTSRRGHPLGTRIARAEQPHPALPARQTPAEEPPAASAPAAPVGWRSTDARGIVVVPINSPAAP